MKMLKYLLILLMICGGGVWVWGQGDVAFDCVGEDVIFQVTYIDGTNSIVADLSDSLNNIIVCPMRELSFDIENLPVGATQRLQRFNTNTNQWIQIMSTMGDSIVVETNELNNELYRLALYINTSGFVCERRFQFNQVSIQTPNGTSLSCSSNEGIPLLIDVVDYLYFPNEDFVSFEWLQDGADVTGSDQTMLNAEATGSYQVDIVLDCDGSGSNQVYFPSNTVEIVGGSAPTISLSAMQHTNNCALRILSAIMPTGDNYQYQWFFEGTDLELNTQNITANQAGEYFLTVTDNSTGCMVSDSYVVNESDLPISPTVEITPIGDEFTLSCAQDELIFNAENSSSSNLTYNWKLSNNVVGSTANFTLSALNYPDLFFEGASLELEVTDPTSNCLSVTEILINVDTRTPDVEFENFVTTVCEDNELLVIEKSNYPNDSYEWEGNGTIDGNSFLVNTADAGTEILRLTVTDLMNGCINEDSLTYTIQSFPQWTDLYNQPYQFQPNSEISLGDDSYQWQLQEAINVNTGTLPTFGSNTIDFRGVVPAVLNERIPGSLVYGIFYDDNVCLDSNLLVVNLFPDNTSLFIPEVLTPNDDGINDEWNLGLPSDSLNDDLRVAVYDRSGRLVYESSGTYIPWRAQECPDGVYYYQIEYEDSVYQGAVTVIGKE